jgi:hypothetical protein
VCRGCVLVGIRGGRLGRRRSTLARKEVQVSTIRDMEEFRVGVPYPWGRAACVCHDGCSCYRHGVVECGDLSQLRTGGTGDSAELAICLVGFFRAMPIALLDAWRLRLGVVVVRFQFGGRHRVVSLVVKMSGRVFGAY